MQRDTSRRSSYHDLGRKVTKSDLSIGNDGIIGFEDDNKESSSDVLDSSLDDITHNWSEDDVDHVIRRGSLLRRPVRTKSRTSFLSRRMSNVSVASSEEGEVS